MSKPTTAAILALAIAGCACMEPQAQTGKPDPFNPKVWLVDNQIVVDQEPIILPKAAQGAEVVFTFRMEPSVAHQFPAGGIEFVQKEGPKTPITCAIQDKGKVFRCSYKNNGKARWKYTIAVLKGGKDRLVFDPHVVQD